MTSQPTTPEEAERRRLLDSPETNIDSASYGSTLRDTSPAPELPVKPLNDISGRDLAWTLIGIWSAVFLGSLDGTIVATLLSPIGSDFNSSNQSSYLGTSYLLSVCCFTPLYGRLSDILGRKGAMLLALSFFGVGTIMCGLAPSMGTLIAARAVAGMGGGGMMTVSSVAVTDLIPLKQRGLYQGMANILFGLGAGIGGPLGGWINDVMGWRAAFLLQIPVLIISFVLVAVKVNIKLPSNIERESLRSQLRRIDFFGSLTLVLAVSSLLLGFSLKGTEELPWGSPIVVSLIASSFVFWILFILVEKHWAPYPVMPMRLITKRTPLAVCLSNFFTAMVAFSTLYNVPLYFAAVKLNSSTDAGLHLLPNSVALSVGSIFAGWVMRRTGKFYYLTMTSAALGFVASLLMANWGPRTSSFELWFDIVPSGFGMASLITTTLIAMIADVAKEDMAVATGITYLFRTTGQVLGVSLSGALLQAVLWNELRARITGPGSAHIIDRIRHSTGIIPTLEPELQRAATDSYATALRVVFICQACMSFICLLCTLPIEERSLPGTHQEQEEHYRRQSAASE